MENSRPPESGLRKQNDTVVCSERDASKNFNVKRATGEKVDLTRCDLRGLDLQGPGSRRTGFHRLLLAEADLAGSIFAKPFCKAPAPQCTRFPAPISPRS